MSTKSQPPYQVNLKENTMHWKTEHNISYTPLNARENRGSIHKNIVRKIQIKHPFSFVKLYTLLYYIC